MEVDVPDSAIQECTGVSALGCVSRLMLQKNSSVAKEGVFGLCFQTTIFSF